MATDSLKRVGLVFNADNTVNFRKSLQEVNLELNKNYNQFKLVQSQWDKSTGSVKKLRAEQEYLKNAYEIQADKVSVLKMQLSDLENAENKNTQAIKKKRNELTSAEIKLQSYNKRIQEIDSQLSNSGKKIEEFGAKIQKSGNSIEKVGKKISSFSLATAAAFGASVKSSIDFESAFAGVEKTVDGTEKQMNELKQGIREMAKEMPSSTTEISAVAEAAGQLGIKTENILSFSKAMIDLGNSTNLSAEEAASQLAKFANIMNMSQKDFDKLGSSIVDLGNHFATTEADIVNMAMRLAGAGKQLGLSEGQVLGLATALSSVGIEAEMGGSAISKAMVKMQNAVELGGTKLNDVLKKTGLSLRELEILSNNNSKDFNGLATDIGMTSKELKNLITAGTNLEDFAKISGMTAEEFKKAWKEDAAKALSAFIKGLGNAETQGESAISMLSEMGLTEVRLRDSLLRAANAGDLFNDAISTGTKSWKENTALTNEANKRYATLKSQIEIVVNKLTDCGITIGNKLMPHISKLVDTIEKATEWFSNLSDEQVDFIIKIGLTIAALGPLVTIFGKLASATGTAITGVGTFVQAIGVAKGTITSTSAAVNGLASVFGIISNPIGLACAGIAASIGLIAYGASQAEKETKEAFSNIGNSANDFVLGIDNATSHLNEFNRNLFASSEEQQNLTSQMEQIQNGITTICRTATEERRGYTQQEIEELDTYFEKLRTLNQRELEIEQQISTAIIQQAQTNAESFQGSLDEYKVQSQEWIKTAQDQKAKTIELIEQQTTNELILLNKRYGTEANMQNEAYAKEFNEIISQKQSKIDAANDEVAKVTEAYTNGFANRLLENDKFKAKFEELNHSIEEENKRHQDKVSNIINNGNLSMIEKQRLREREANEHENKLEQINNRFVKNLSKTEAKHLGTLTGMVSETDVYGGKISNKANNIVNSILNSYDRMPSGAKKSMRDSMNPMLEEMQRAEPSLFAKASNIASGIISRLRRAFDERSPSRLTRQIMKFAMDPMVDEMSKGEKELFKESDKLGAGIKKRLNNINNVETANNIKSQIPNNNFSSIDYDKLKGYFNIDYNKLANTIVSAFSSCKLTLDDEGFARIVKDEILKVI